MTCPSCHAPLLGGARFCGTCGHAAMLTASDPRLPAVADPMGAMIGKEIAGRFRIVALLGEGGMGAVFRAEQLSLKRTVALKLLRPSLASSAQLIRRFNAEAQAVAQLNHPNTVGIHDFGEHEGMLFIAMELIEGRSLREVVHREAPLSPARALMLASQVAASLADAHAHGIVHRDLKPDNVMLQQRGKQRDVVRVLDFGIAKLRDESRGNMTAAGDILGTPQYIAPEQAKGEAIDGRTDIYALGCMLYEMLTGRLPFEGPSVMALLAAHVTQPVVPPAQRRPELAIPPALDALVVAAMQKDPAARPATMDAFGEQMAAILATLPPEPAYPTTQGSIAAGTPMLTPVAATPPRSRRGLIAAVLGVLAIGAISAGAYVATRGKTTTEPPPPFPTPIRTPAAELQGHPAPDAAPDPSPDPTPVDPTPVDPTPAPVFDPATQSANLPDGAHLLPTEGFAQTRDATSDKLVDQARGVIVTLVPINDRGDIKVLAGLMAKLYGVSVDHIGRVTSAGAERDAAWMTGTIDGVPSKMLMVLYDGPSYRVVGFGAEPLAIWDEDAALQFFAQNVVMPGGS